MSGPQKVKKSHYKKRVQKRTNKTYGTKTLDQIRVKKVEYDEDLIGCGLFPCDECDRYFIDEKTLVGHKKTKAHKRRIKELKEIPYTVKESERCAGLYSKE